jgi:hypothetical protein
VLWVAVLAKNFAVRKLSPFLQLKKFRKALESITKNIPRIQNKIVMKK